MNCLTKIALGWALTATLVVGITSPLTYAGARQAALAWAARQPDMQISHGVTVASIDLVEPMVYRAAEPPPPPPLPLRKPSMPGGVPKQ